MRRYLLAAAVAAIPLVAHAQLNLTVSMKEPVTGLDSDTWATLARNVVDGTSLLGKPEVYVVNATPFELVVNCDKWQLVGPKPYIDANPHSLRPWKVTEINVKGFDGYCKDGTNAISSNGDTYYGALTSADGSFTNATFITFSAKTKR